MHGRRILFACVWLGLMAGVLASITNASSASTTLPETSLGLVTTATEANQFKPHECEALNLQVIVLGDAVQANASVPALILGSDGADTLHAGNANGNCIVGGAGNDALVGGNGRDVLLGGAGDDVLNGGDGLQSVCYGGPNAYSPNDIYFNCAVVLP